MKRVISTYKDFIQYIFDYKDIVLNSVPTTTEDLTRFCKDLQKNRIGVLDWKGHINAGVKDMIFIRTFG